MSIKKLLLGILTFTIAANPYFVYAEQITVSGNGENSSNGVNIQSNNNNEVTQNNNATVTNNVDVSANTGNNEANDNTGGDTNISTGNVTVDTQVVNAGINQSYAEVGCCPDSVSIDVKGNGSNSSNNVSYSSNNNTNINVNNNAYISNNIKGYANTGYNSANSNTNANVSIDTGSIKVTDTIKNKGINISEVHATAGTGQSVYISVNENGESSVNNVTVDNDSSVNINVDNSANIDNNSNWELNTGGNEANGNTGGDVEITTGDIVFKSTIENTDINVSYVDVDCCNEKENPNPNNPPDSTPPPAPNNNPSNPSNPSGGVGPTQTVLGAVTGDILPVTGNYLMLFLMIGNVIMFFLGGYLRLRSGRAPNYAYAR